MKKILIILLILSIILVVGVYSVYRYRTNVYQIQKQNREYEQYYNINVLGTELISIINKTIDLNTKNNITKDDKGYFVDNGENSIKINVEFKYKNDTKTISMEEIASIGAESFVKVYSTANFKCTKIEYHEKTHNVKNVTFEEVSDI